MAAKEVKQAFLEELFKMYAQEHGLDNMNTVVRLLETNRPKAVRILHDFVQEHRGELVQEAQINLLSAIYA